MTPEQIEELRADMAAGTPGDFFVSTVDPRRICDKRGLSVARAHLLGNRGEYGEAHANASRFARVPTLEAEVLRLTEANAALAEEVARVRGALTFYALPSTYAEGDIQRAPNDGPFFRPDPLIDGDRGATARAALSHTGMTGQKENE